MQINTPKEIVDLNMQGAVKKANMGLPKMITLGILAGMFIALGGVTSSTAVHSISNLGLAKVLGGAVFPIGLLMIVLVGGELFTGNCLMIMATLDKRFTVMHLIRNLLVVFLANFFGAFIIDVLVFHSGNLNLSGGALGAYTIKVAVDKSNISFVNGLASGILCNFLVCMSIMNGTAAKDVAGKILATWFPIFVFVLDGFEHIVANMYYIPVGILAKTDSHYVALAKELYGITEAQLEHLDFGGILQNFIPVTIGNLLGGMFIGIILYFINIKYDKINGRNSENTSANS